jgi:hypothetical protein
VRIGAQPTQSAQVLLVTALGRTTAAMVIRPIPHHPHRLTELAMAMGRITAATAIHPTAMLATAIRLMAMAAATTSRACALPAGWRSIEPVGAKGVGHTDRRVPLVCFFGQGLAYLDRCCPKDISWQTYAEVQMMLSHNNQGMVQPSS